MKYIRIDAVPIMAALKTEIKKPMHSELQIERKIDGLSLFQAIAIAIVLFLPVHLRCLMVNWRSKSLHEHCRQCARHLWLLCHCILGK